MILETVCQISVWQTPFQCTFKAEDTLQHEKMSSFNWLYKIWIYAEFRIVGGTGGLPPEPNGGKWGTKAS